MRGARGELLVRSSPRIYSFILSSQHRHIGEHVFNKDAISRCRIIDEDVGDGADELSILNDGGAGRECGQVGTTVFYKKIKS